MKSNRSLSDIAAEVLASEAKRPPEPAAESRARTIDAIVGAMRVRKRKQRIQRSAIGVAAVAATIAIALGFGRAGLRAEPNVHAVSTANGPSAAASFVRGSPAVERHGTRIALAEGTPLVPGDRVLVERGSRATVTLANGTYLAIDEHADLVLTSPAPATTFELAAGSVRADVAKLKPGERFVIRTTDAEIEVHGTSFEVSRVEADPACGNGTTTRVEVREGIVSVRANGTEAFVHPNEVWPSGCAAPSTDAPRPDARAPTGSGPSNARDQRPISASRATVKRTTDAPASDLAAQNDLFERAIARKRAGDLAGAIRALDDLLVRYPSSHLAQSARAERMKLLRGVDAKRARAAAREYLEKHPNGFARRDAELIVGAD